MSAKSAELLERTPFHEQGAQISLERKREKERDRDSESNILAHRKKFPGHHTPSPSRESTIYMVLFDLHNSLCWKKKGVSDMFETNVSFKDLLLLSNSTCCTPRLYFKIIHVTARERVPSTKPNTIRGV